MNATIKEGLERLQGLIDELETRVSMLEDESEIIIDAVVEDADKK